MVVTGEVVPTPLRHEKYVRERRFLGLWCDPWNVKEESGLSHPKQVVRKTVDEASNGSPVYSTFQVPEK